MMRMVKFDKNAPGGGVSARCHLENGKAVLEWQIDCIHIEIGETEEKLEGTDTAKEEYYGQALVVRICLTDMDGKVVLECVQSWDEEEPLTSVLLQPRLWAGPDNPYLYRLEAVLEDSKGNYLDSVKRQFPLRCVELRKISGEETDKLFLNGEQFVPKAVRYDLPTATAAEEQYSQMPSDLQQIVRLGANCICLMGDSVYQQELTDFCEEKGLLTVLLTPGKIYIGGMVFAAETDCNLQEFLGDMPVFCGDEKALFLRRNTRNETSRCANPTPYYYQYKARWSREPFVYLLPESLKRLKSGNYMVTCYSNCKRVALYSDGSLFEFQRGEEVFTFQEIPAKGPCIMLAAEGDGCSVSLSIHKTFTKLSPFGDN